MKAEVVIDGVKNVVVEVSGVVEQGDTILDILQLSSLQPPPKALRIDAVQFAIEEKMGIKLWWRGREDDELILPLESRGYFDFSKIHSLNSPRTVQAIGISFFNVPAGGIKSFLLQLDMEKQQ